MPAQAAVPTRSETVRLQGATTTVNVFQAVGTRNIYLRATTIKRTLGGTIVRAGRFPIRWTVTKPVVLDGKVVAKVSAGATGQGASQPACDRMANAINSWFDHAWDQLSAEPPDAAGGRTALNNAQALVDQALDAGCFVVF